MVERMARPIGKRRCGRVRLEHRVYPAEEAALEAIRIDQHQHPAEGVVGGNAAPQLEEALQPVPLAAAVEGDVLKLSASPSTAQIAITRTSMSRCSTFHPQRGSSMVSNSVIRASSMA